MNWAGFITNILLVSFAIPSIASQPQCKSVLAQVPSIHQWGSGNYIAQMKPRTNPAKNKSPYVFHVYDGAQIHRQMVNSKESAFPLLRIELQKPNIQEVEFFNYSKQLVVQFEKESFLYELGSKKETYKHRIKASRLENAQVKAHNNRLYQYNNKELLISVHPRDWNNKEADPSSFRGAKAKELLVSLESNKKLKEVFSEESHLFGISLLFAESPILLLDYNSQNSAGKRERRIGFYDLVSGVYTSRAVDQIFKEKTDTMPGGEKLKDPTKLYFSQVYAEIPLIMTGKAEHATKHPVEWNASELRIEALTYGYIPLIESLFQP